jgi:hypothetical protein
MSLEAKCCRRPPNDPTYQQHRADRRHGIVKGNTMGEKKRREAKKTQANGTIPTIPREIAQQISAALEAEDNVGAAEKAIGAIVDFGLDTMLAAFDSATKFTFILDESSGPFWTTLVKGFIARQPERQADESNEEYDARVVTALSAMVDRIHERLFTTLQVPPKDREGLGVTADPIKVGDRFVDRMCLCWTKEAAERLIGRMAETIRSGAFVP